MGAVRLSGKLVCASDDEVGAVEAYLPEHVRLTRLEPGCLSFEVTQSENPLIWRVEEQFADMAAFEAHQARTRASNWFAATKNIIRAFEMQETP